MNSTARKASGAGGGVLKEEFIFTVDLAKEAQRMELECCIFALVSFVLTFSANDQQ